MSHRDDDRIRLDDAAIHLGHSDDQSICTPDDARDPPAAPIIAAVNPRG